MLLIYVNYFTNKYLPGPVTNQNFECEILYQLIGEGSSEIDVGCVRGGTFSAI